MAKIALIFGVALLAVGLLGYFGAPAPSADANPSASANADQTAAVVKKPSKTALIPALFGIVLMICGTVGMESRWRKHAMHVAAGVALIGAIAGTILFATRVSGFLAGSPEVNRRSFAFIVAMAVLCWVYLILSIRSFVIARRQREESAG